MTTAAFDQEMGLALAARGYSRAMVFKDTHGQVHSIALQRPGHTRFTVVDAPRVAPRRASDWLDTALFLSLFRRQAVSRVKS